MKYRISKNGFLIKDNGGASLSCPYTMSVLKLEGGVDYMRSDCGDWCPLFNNYKQKQTTEPQKSFPFTKWINIPCNEVRLHCGSGTRIIEIERDERETPAEKT